MTDATLNSYLDRVRAADNEGLAWYDYGFDALKGAWAGSTDAAEETYQFGRWALDGLVENTASGLFNQEIEFLDDETERLFWNPPRPSTGIGRFSEDVSQFATGFLGAGKFKAIGNVGSKIFKEGSKKATSVSAAAKSATSSVVAHNPYEERLSDLLIEYPATTNFVTEFLASNEDDDLATRRLKMGLEDIGLGLVIETGLFFGAKAVKASRSGKNPEAAIQEADEAITGAGETAAKDDKAKKLKLQETRAAANAEDDARQAVIREGGDPDAAGLPKDKIIEDVLNHTELEAKKYGINRDEFIDRLTAKPLMEYASRLGIKVGEKTKAADTKAKIKEVLNEKVNSVNKTVETPKVKVDTRVTEDQIAAALKGITDPQQLTDVFQNTKTGTFKLFNRTQQGDISIAPDDFPDEVTAVIQQTINASKPLLDKMKGTQSVNDVTEAVAMRLSESSNLTPKQWLDTAYLHAGNIEEAMVTLHSIESMLLNSSERLYKLLDDNRYENSADHQAIVHAEIETFNKFLAASQKLESPMGRALRMRREKIFDSNAAADIVADLGGKKGLDRFVTAVRASGGNLGKVGKATSQLRQLTVGQKTAYGVGELFRGMILFNIKTHVTNIASGATESMIVPMERYIGSFIPYGRNPFGAEAKQIRQDTVYHLVGLSSSIKDSMSLAASSFRAEKNFLDPTNTKLDGGDVQNKISSGFVGIRSDTIMGRFLDTIGKASRGSLRALGSEDEFFKQINYRARVFAGAMREASELMSKGTLKNKKEVKQYALKKVTEAFDESGKGLDEGALQYAREVTFTEELRKGSGALTLQRATQNHPTLQLFLPFVRTPTNLIVRASQRTPLPMLPLTGFLTKSYDDTLKNGTPEEQAQMLGRVALGSTIIGGFAFAALEGRITGSGPVGVDQNRLWRAAGNQPYSILVGDKWVSYNRADPIMMPVGAMANMFDSMKHLGPDDPILTEALPALIFAMSKTLQDKAYFQGVSNFLEGLQTDDPRQLAKLTNIIENMGASFIPIAPLQVTEGFSRLSGEYPELSEAVGFIDKLQRRLPSYIDNLPPKYNWLTGEIIKNPDAFSTGFPVVPDKTTELVGSELVRLNYGFRGPPRRLEGVKLNTEQYADFNKLMGTLTNPYNGQNLMQALEQTILDPRYRRTDEAVYDGVNLTRETKAITDVLSQYRRAARDEVMRKYPDLFKEVTNRKINDRAGERLLETNR